MPIYAYKCSNCDHAQDVLQKMSDPRLTDCPECGQSTYTKQVTAAGFQLKGSGWYVTDFRNNGTATGVPAPATTSTAAESGGATSGSSPAAASPAAASATPASAASGSTAS